MPRPIDRLKHIFGDSPQAAISEGRCVKPPLGCGQKIDPMDFKDAASEREYQISGMCQFCQDQFFGDGESDEPYVPGPEEMDDQA